MHSLPNCRHFLVGDLNSEMESHNEILHLTGANNGIQKHTFQVTGEDLDHVAILPKFWFSFIPPIVKEVSVLTNLNWSDHWPIHVLIYCETKLRR